MYQRITVDPGIRCDVPFDIDKSVTEFSETQDEEADCYRRLWVVQALRRRRAHYQTVTIIRNKVKGPVRALLTSYNTVWNYYATIGRLDWINADKSSLRLLLQLETVRQGDIHFPNTMTKSNENWLSSEIK